ncbi:hypothetical protein scyTo_0020770 [Scyliorhinus torazame]|uniref:Uncharacterized protein n=1 Tax=Scyliorhinus torazame TaxID=75743 RepID=A0A401Q1R1_SCYTO|nr:hypothetical protein [Scyliorhinus torazame]
MAAMLVQREEERMRWRQGDGIGGQGFDTHPLRLSALFTPQEPSAQAQRCIRSMRTVILLGALRLLKGLFPRLQIPC